MTKPPKALYLGFRDISTLLALTGNQPDPSTAKRASEILAMRKAGERWGQIARDLGCKNLRSVRTTVRKKENAAARAAAARGRKAEGRTRVA